MEGGGHASVSASKNFISLMVERDTSNILVQVRFLYKILAVRWREGGQNLHYYLSDNKSSSLRMEHYLFKRAPFYLS